MVIEIDSGKLKFLCSYNGKIVPRPGDGLLRYVGGLNRVLAVDRSISYVELMVKLVVFCGFSMDLKCQLPDGDLETLITIKSDVELASLIEEYDRAWLSSNTAPSKIRAVLTHPKSLKKISPTPSVDFSSPKSAGSPCLRSVFPPDSLALDELSRQIGSTISLQSLLPAFNSA